MAWIQTDRQKHDAAKKLYLEALELLEGTGHFELIGYIWNGLGRIHQRKQEYNEALGHYQRALECWMLVDYFYGIQIVYFNIGHIYTLWGGQLEKAGWMDKAKERYEQALGWIRQCIEICQTASIAYDLNEDHVLLSSLYRRLGRPKDAIQAAKLAKRMAEHAGNPKGVGRAYRALVKSYAADGTLAEARSTLERWKKAVAPEFQEGIGTIEASLVSD